MSNPTSNFGWQMPTPTDLVTDLPADFEVFGQAVDTSLADLKGGTTGQILSKATNADMDFTWIANDQGDITEITATSPLTGGGTSGAITVGIQASSTTQSGAVQLTDSTSSTSTTTAATPNSVKSAYDLANAAVPKSLVDAKADLITATADNTPARLAVGANETRLVADSVQATGLKYVADTTNYAINAKGDLLAGTAADTLTALSVGTNGQTLVADSSTATGLKWATPASGGGLTLLQTLSCTTASTTSSSISSSYKSIYIELVGGQLNGEQITLRFNSDASGLYYAGAVGSTANQAMTATSIALSYQNVGNVATNLMAITIPNYANTSTHKILFAYGMSQNDSSSYMINNVVGAYRSTSAISTITIKSSTGAAITATAYIYGVN